jgi:hypothetical protein
MSSESCDSSMEFPAGYIILTIVLFDCNFHLRHHFGYFEDE